MLAGILLIGLAGAHTASAGFGITPPYLRSDRLARGTVYTQVINLVRSDAPDDLKVTITLNIPGAQEWVSVDKGNEFIIPKGVTQLPITVSVRVPNDAPYKEYTGTMRIRTSSANPAAAGGVSIALGAQVDVDLKVVDKILDFDVRQVRISDLEEGIQKFGLFFPGKMKFYMTIENTGNAVYGPTKVHFDIYDSNMENLLESVDNTNKIEKIAPFTIKEVLAELPTRLPNGSYAVKYAIYKDKDIAQQGELNMSVAAIGTVAGYQGYGFDGLSLEDKLKIAAVIILPVLLFVIFMVFAVRRRRRRKKMNGYPPR